MINIAPNLPEIQVRPWASFVSRIGMFGNLEYLELIIQALHPNDIIG